MARPKLLIAAVAALVLLAAAPAAQGRVVVSSYGSAGELGGQFASPGTSGPFGTAVNSSGSGGVAPGTVYFADTSNNRIQRFSPAGAFERAWGQNVSGPDEQQRIDLSHIPTTGGNPGTFTLTFGGSTTAPIGGTASEAIVESALAVLPSIGAGNVTVSRVSVNNGSAWIVRFTGALSGTDVAPMTIDGSGLQPEEKGAPPPTAAVTTLKNGAGGPFAGFEICTVAASCQGAQVTGTVANGGQLNGVWGIAVNQASGHVYAYEEVNRRISEFDANGNFIRTFGWDVIMSGKPGDVVGPALNEKQTLTPRGTSGETVQQGILSGTFTLTFSSKTTTDIPFNASAATVRSALEALPSIGAGNVLVTTPPSHESPDEFPSYRVEFTGAFAGTDVAQLTGNGAKLLDKAGKPGQIDVTTTTPAGPAGGFEICAAPADCKQAAVGGTDGGRFRDGSRNHPVFDASNNLWIPDPRSLRIQEFSPTGAFIAAYGWDVDALGGGGGLEKCTSTAPGACQGGAPGSAPGQFGRVNRLSLSPLFLAFDSAGNLYADDEGNGRVLRFNPSLTSATTFLTNTASFEIRNPVMTATNGGSRIAITGRNKSGGADKPSGILEYDLAGNLVETSIPDLGSFGVSGLAFDQSSGRLYASHPNSLDGRILVLGTLPAAAPAMDPVTTFAAKTATFTGTVDPMGAPVNCAFQYSENQVTWTDVAEPDCGSLATGGGPQALSQSVAGLDPATHYYVRLRASRLFDNSSAVDSTPPREFTTEAIPPEITKVGAIEVADTTATLVGAVNPGKDATAYHFDYGTQGPCDANPCASTPNGNLPTGITTATVVSAHITGLAPDTTYHFRLVAANSSPVGPTESADVTLRTRAPIAPADRAYEMVSPPDKNGGSALSGYQFATVAYDGQALGFCTDSLFGEPSGVQGAFCARYRSRRTAGGWQTQPATPYLCRNDHSGDNSITIGAAHQYLRFSRNLDASTIQQPESASCPLSPLDPAAPLPQNNLYRSVYSAGAPSYDLLAPEPISGSNAFNSLAWSVGASSADFTQIAYLSTSNQTPDALTGNFKKIYEWDDGALRLASVKPDGSAFTTAAQVPGGTVEVIIGLGDQVNAMSADGSRLFFETPIGTTSQELYMREGGTATYDVSASECTASCGSSAADTLLYASKDGSKALISTTAKLTNTDTNATGNDLFLYTHGPDPASEQNLTFISKDNEPADGTKAEVLDVLGLSDDGDTVFFAANGQLIAGAPIAGPNLYRWQRNGGAPTLTYLGVGEADNWAPSNRREENRLVTPDGRHLLIRSKAQLDPIADYDSSADYYRWSEEDGWTCASCQFPGAASSGDASGIALVNESFQRRIAMSDDGERVFFSSSDALAPQDTNGKADVYEWHAGTVGLVSSGKSTQGARLLGASASGEDVFFSTQERLVGWDTDSVRDIYDARLNGGFPEPPPPPSPCDMNAGACEGAGTSAPEQTGAGSAAFEGPGNPAPPAKRSCPKGKRQVRVRGKERCVARHAHKKHKRHDKRQAKHERRNAR